MSVYYLEAQLEKGEEYEGVLDTFFSSQYDIEEATFEQQHFGIDRLFTSKKRGIRASVEYKTDFIAQRTGNVFIEVENNEADYTGWASSSTAQILVYFIPEMNVIFMADMLKIKLDIDFLCVNYGIRTVKNETYNMLGTPIPIDKFREYAIMEAKWRK